MGLLGTNTAQVDTKRIYFDTGIMVIWLFSLADCTLGKEWAAWGECVPSTGTCGNGTRQRFKEELYPSRHGGACEKNPGTETCTKDCPPSSANTEIIAGVVILLLLIIIITLFFINKKRPEYLNSLMRKDKPNILIPDVTVSNRRKSIIFKKGDDLKNDVVYSTEDERRRFEEFKDLEAKVAKSVSPVKTTEIARKEDNAKHNRYRDIGKQTTDNHCF